MTTTLSDIIALVRLYINEPTSGFWSNTDITTFINYNFLQIAKILRIPKGTNLQALTKDATTFTLPTDFIMMDKKDRRGGRASVLAKIGVGSTWVELDGKWSEEIGMAAIKNAASGTPESWYPYSESKIGIHPPFSGTTIANGLEINYIKVPTALNLVGISITGTITFTNGSAAVVGAGSLFTTELTNSDQIKLNADGVYYAILSITDNTHLTLTTNYTNTGGSGGASKDASTNELTELYYQICAYGTTRDCFLKRGNEGSATLYNNLFSQWLGVDEKVTFNRWQIGPEYEQRKE